MIFRVEETCTWEDWDAWRKTYTLHGRVLGGAVRATFGFQRAWGVFMMAFGGLLILLGLLGGLVSLITLIGAAALMRPSKSVADMELKSLKKKYKSKGFAAGCSREVIERGAAQLGWELEKLLTMTLQAMADCEDEIQAQMQE